MCTLAQKKARVLKAKHLLAWHADSEIIFSDEKMFLLQDFDNQQNDRVWAISLHDIPKEKLAVERYQNHSSVMVWGAISKRGKLPLYFVEKGVKINQGPISPTTFHFAFRKFSICLCSLCFTKRKFAK